MDEGFTLARVYKSYSTNQPAYLLDEAEVG